eukprot:2696168-Rhodomonas_salina.1
MHAVYTCFCSGPTLLQAARVEVEPHNHDPTSHDLAKGPDLDGISSKCQRPGSGHRTGSGSRHEHNTRRFIPRLSGQLAQCLPELDGGAFGEAGGSFWAARLRSREEMAEAKPSRPTAPATA